MRSFLLCAVRVGAALLLTAVLFPLTSGTAAAHGGGLEASPSVARILAVDPLVPGLAVAVIEVGARLRIVNDTGEPVQVVPAGPTRGVEPVVPPGTTARWADPRIDAAMLPIPAEGVRAWSVPLLVGDREVTVRGEQVFPPAPTAGLWWLATAVAAVVAGMIGIMGVTRRWAALATAAITVLVVGAHVVHVLGAALVPDDQAYLLVVVSGAGLGLAAWLAGAVGVVLTVLGRRFGLLLCGLAGAVLAMITAFGTVGFSNAVLAFGWSAGIDRLTTVLTFGAGIGLFLTGFAVLRALTPDLPVGDDDPPPAGDAATADATRRSGSLR
ncbi:hypothetical protein I4I73_22000 [Pseudonocardia sp. KRD-184]|uniref:Uncharacterized protein n=1 Tax=Pseudonocardia oceani TaxID=2792013 RepID=A0ABS6U2M0_9PSEU|nr:hypothetical protein [Pseudonocardia oceani]MBW0092511.1 hypothetical protein [Pseudonocardia oceani]MBW0098664.1 hypothetical protein [Pseudonocardia oceani]MBW0121954.1 hypothetical protein [Pseudonocardia oceani]MBW0126492.1 hypothetical protein [Pseudonocardia oceani]